MRILCGIFLRKVWERVSEEMGEYGDCGAFESVSLCLLYALVAELSSKNFYIVAVGEYFRLVVLVVPEAQHLSRRSENINIG